MQLSFLGTGGGRFTMIKQLRKTGGMHLSHDEYSLYIDPGPGALVHAHRQGIALEDLDALLVTHAHLDHCGDMHAVIEAMSDGGKEQRGTLYCAESVVDGAEIPDRYTEGEGVYGAEIAPPLDAFHRDAVGDLVRLRDGEEYEIGPFAMRCMETDHSDPRTVAFTLDDGGRRVGFVSDGAYTDRHDDFFTDCDALVVNLMRPHTKDWKGHLNTADAAALLNAVEPDLAVMQHFGAALVYAGVAAEAEWLRDQTHVDVIMADDGMTIDPAQPQEGLDAFL